MKFQGHIHDVLSVAKYDVVCFRPCYGCLLEGDRIIIGNLKLKALAVERMTGHCLAPKSMSDLCVYVSFSKESGLINDGERKNLDLHNTVITI